MNDKQYEEETKEKCKITNQKISSGQPGSMNLKDDNAIKIENIMVKFKQFKDRINHDKELLE